MSVRHLVEEFSALEDPRCGGKIEHRLIDILVIAVCAVIAGAESYRDQPRPPPSDLKGQPQGVSQNGRLE
jgi:predicted RNase H-like nuclease